MCFSGQDDDVQGMVGMGLWGCNTGAGAHTYHSMPVNKHRAREHSCLTRMAAASGGAGRWFLLEGVIN